MLWLDLTTVLLAPLASSSSAHTKRPRLQINDTHPGSRPAPSWCIFGSLNRISVCLGQSGYVGQRPADGSASSPTYVFYMVDLPERVMTGGVRSRLGLQALCLLLDYSDVPY